MQRQESIPSARQEQQVPTAKAVPRLQNKKHTNGAVREIHLKWYFKRLLSFIRKTSKQNQSTNKFLPYKCRGYSQNNCTPFIFWIAIIKYVTNDFRVRRHACASPSCWYAQVEHGLAAQELPDARPQDFPTISLSAAGTHGGILGYKGKNSCLLCSSREIKG